MENEMKIQSLLNRKNVLTKRDPIANANIIKKIDRRIRALGG